MKFKRQIVNIKLRAVYKNLELLQKVLKFLILYIKDDTLMIIIQFNLNLILCFKTSIKRYCVISGRSRSVYKKFKVSRIIFRYLGVKGLFFGLKKLSW